MKRRGRRSKLLDDLKKEKKVLEFEAESIRSRSLVNCLFNRLGTRRQTHSAVNTMYSSV